MKAQKQAARQLIRQRHALHLENCRAKAWQGAWLEALAQHSAFSTASVVLLFYSLPDEVPTQPLLERWRGEKTLLLPSVVENDLQLHPYHDETCMMVGAWGINEPTTPLWTDVEAIDLVLVPGLAFDAQGHRLGRGKGYYDRLLAHPHFSTIPLLGLAYHYQQLDDLPYEPHDHRVDEVFWI